jgi:hypothetical protein
LLDWKELSGRDPQEGGSPEFFFCGKLAGGIIIRET